MARNFNGSTEDLEVAVALISAEPITMCCWFQTENVTAAQTVFALSNADSAKGFIRIAAMGNVGGDPLRVQKQDDPGTTGSTDTSTSVSADVWNFGLAFYTTDTSRTILLNNGGEIEGTDDVPDPTNDQVNVGVLEQSTGKLQWFAGDLSNACVWSVVLSADERSALNNGVNPFVIRNSNLIFFAPINGNESPEPDYAQQNNLTLTNAPTKSTTNPPVELLENYL